jgi:hypothetical protein
MAPYMALREGRHPQGEYVLTRDDILHERKFPDAVLKRTLEDPLDTSPMPRVNERGELMPVKSSEGSKQRSYTCDIPYRAFLPKKVKNLLLAAECLSCTHEWFYGYRFIPWGMRTGEVAATAAVTALKQGFRPKRSSGPRVTLRSFDRLNGKIKRVEPTDASSDASRLAWFARPPKAPAAWRRVVSALSCCGPGSRSRRGAMLRRIQAASLLLGSVEVICAQPAEYAPLF